MNNIRIVFNEPYKVSVAEDSFEQSLKDGELLVRKLYSLISTGTELACLSGNEAWFKMPDVPGYCCVSEVCKTGPNAVFKKGDKIFHYGRHSLYQVISSKDFIVLVSGEQNLKYVPILRMATVAFTAVRISDIELGDYVAVSGLGLVGNMAAQLATLSGARVIGIDPSPKRRILAQKCRIAHAVDSAAASEEIKNITGELGVHTVIEATGIPAVVCGMLPSISYHGEIILLGTPRGDYKVNLADVLRYSHLESLGSITFKGAHEWRYPVKKDRFVKHSIERNTEICIDLIKNEKLKVNELISHVIEPKDAPEIYLGVNANRNDYLGILIDWTRYE